MAADVELLVRGVVSKTRQMGKRLVFCDVVVSDACAFADARALAGAPAPDAPAADAPAAANAAPRGAAGVAAGQSVDVMLEASMSTYRGAPFDVLRFVRSQHVPTRGGWFTFHIEVVASVELEPNARGVRVLRARELRSAEAEPLADPDEELAHAKEPKAARHAIFADWLVRQFGAAALAARGGVVDVGGGKGGVSLALVSQYGVPCTIVDPVALGDDARALRASGAPLAHVRAALTRDACAELAAVADRDRAAAAVGAGGEGERDGDGEDGAPLVAGDARICEPCAQGGDGARPGGARRAAGAQPAGWRRRPRRAARSCAPAARASAADADVLRALRDASVIVGMHPDQGTEPLVRAALALSLPYAVVPCCVFARENGHRRLAGGQGVVSCGSLCAFLEQLDAEGRTRSVLLPFEGRNRLVYRL
ncbi:hypothetical protein KFE25_009833 [Diacronema lutheri]|uniref:Uncharacterized protein n=1 Tax=Diacronema lutheri TaxID=2081491 RepID=A0A8J5X2V9_DIALT|nr:hypothetical protein KFE25_009833 [Diacronema lutheri]